MEGDVSGVRILPPLIEFKDSSVNKLYKVNITVKNVSKTSKEVRYYGPQTKQFKLKVKNPEKPVAPGLEVSAVVEYVSTEALPHKDRLVVTVDGTVLEVPLLGYPCQPLLAIEGPVDFGHVVASSKVIAREINIFNHGSKEGEFKLKYTGDKPIALIPSSGKIPANSSTTIKIEYVTKVAGTFDEVVKVKLEGQESSHLHVKGEVVDGALELLHCETDQLLPCVDFGSTYYGTDQTQAAMLCNNGPEPVCFVAVLQEDAIGQEVTSTGQAGGKMNPLTSLVTAIPNQGMLGPYERIPIFFRFSPRWTEAKQGFRCSQQPPPRQQFALFMHFKAVGASDGFQGDPLEADKPKSNVEGFVHAYGSILEVALRGTAQPVLVSVAPLSKFDFGECPVGEHVDTLCTLHNDSTTMPIHYQFRRVAHFVAKPSNGRIECSEGQDAIFSFRPNQAGTFKPTQYVDILGQVADELNPFSLRADVIHSIPIQFLGRSDPITIKKDPVFNPGITPKITNEVGMYVDTTFATSDKRPRAAMLNSQGTTLHSSLKSSKERANEDNKVQVAYPNDRASSIRPSDRRQRFQTLYTRSERHTYVDPDYSFTDPEMDAVRTHKDKYLHFVDEMREGRRNAQRAKEYRENNNKKDIAIKPAAGLRPKRIKQEDVGPDPPSPRQPNVGFKLLSSKELAKSELQSAQNVKDGLNAIPSTVKEKADCQKILSPKELHQVIIGPPTVDFGGVCLKSVTQKEIKIVNNLDHYIHVVVHVDCRELRQTSPLSQVVPPCSKAALPLIFESNTRGRFQRSIDYTINGFYKNHITVFAEVVPVALELSTLDLTVEPQIGLPADAGIRGAITLYNKLNYPAEFTWTPILGDRGTAFSIRPATGVVEANTDLDCEVVFHPSYMAPEEGYFALQVHGGNALKLKCNAKLGSTNVQFIDRRIMFGQVPLHMTTTRKAMLKNTGLNHAYFQVLDPNPFPGLTVSPIHGVVPVGGNTQLHIHLTPNAVIKFDTRINISIRGWKTMELRMGGTVEPPVVEIDIPTFNLGGVYCGSSSTTPFKLINKVHTKARIEFDLSRYPDFTLDFPSKQTSEDYTFQLMNPGIFCVTLEADESIECQLIFKPTEVASYDFIMPVTINQTGAPTPSPTPFPPTPTPSNKNSLQHIVNPRPIHVSIATPRRKVVATALRQPLQLSHHALEFSLTPKMHELASAAVLGQNQINTKGTLLVNNSDREVKWAIDISKGNQALEDGIFKFLHASGMPFVTHAEGGVEGTLQPGQTQQLGVIFCPGKPGIYDVTLPVVINDDFDHPYQHLTLTGELKCPHLWFDPLAIVLTPVPLQMDIASEFQIFASDYTKKSTLSAETPEVECGDGSKLTPLTVTFPDGPEIQPCSGEEGQSASSTLTCKVTFKSPKPVSFTQAVVFTDDMGNSFNLLVSATADNCLLTCYPFLAQHRSDHQIVCEQGHVLKGHKTASRETMSVGEAVLLPCTSPPRPGSRPSTTATSSNFEISTSSYEENSGSVTESTYPSTPRDGALNKFTTESEQQSRTNGRNDLQSRSLGSALFPEEDTEEGVFHTEVLLAVQRWFSSQGWPGGPNPITVPDSLRCGISKMPVENAAKNAKGGSFESSGLKKELRTIYDMVSHLCGKPVPGIPINNPLPSDPIERAKQVYWQHATLLTFLKAQGGCITSIKPEYLMEPNDYKAWMHLQKVLESRRNQSGHRGVRVKTEEEETIEDQLFEAVSKRAWTDVLLQLLKTLYLARVTPRQFKNLPTPYKNSAMPVVDPDPLCSNVYSIGERILLLWLNHNYEQQRQRIWANCDKGGVPPSRWIVNFDFDLLDGLVLAAVLAAHVPFLIQSHLKSMYTHPASAEQCLHNALRVVNAMRAVGIDYDISAIDITDPNPIALLLLCIHLYHSLPQYIPRNTVEFVGGLHVMVLRQVRLSNPSTKPLTYHALIAGHDAADFTIPKGEMVSLGPKSHLNLMVEFTSRFLRPAEAVLVLVGRRQGASVGSTLVFNLHSQVDNITPKATVKVESPCYEMHAVPIEVVNPFPNAGEFRLILVEAQSQFPGTALNGKNTGAPLVAAMAKKKKPKKIKSKIDHGQRREPTPEEEDVGVAEMLSQQMEQKEDEDDLLSAFSAPTKSVYLEACGTATVEINFLPFQTGQRNCNLIFINENVGEFIYEIEAVATLPLPGNLPFKPSPHSVRISSAAAIGGSRGTALTGMEDNIVYWKCECGSTLNENLPVPVTNLAKDRALMMAATQHMSEAELERRRVTGTLESNSLTTKALNLLSAAPSKATTSKSASAKGQVFNVELDSDLFSAPSSITLPHTKKEGASVDLPVTFKAKDAGHYTCRVTLTSLDDVRVYFIDCTVIPEGNEAHLEFNSPVHQAIAQDIPVPNNTNHDWPMQALLEGAGFAGPASVMAKAQTTTYYPLVFRPVFEGVIKGQLTLTNTADGVVHTFHLNGKGERPLPLELIRMQCPVKDRKKAMVQVPNITTKKLHYKVESDLDFITGPELVTVLPGQMGMYEMTVAPLRRGHFKGVLAFVAGNSPVKEVDSDGDELDDMPPEDPLHGYTVWYSVEVEVEAPPPQTSLTITCNCQKRVVVEVGVSNPTKVNLTLEAQIKGQGLSGPAELTLAPKARGVYELQFFPAIVGTTKGSLIFYHEAIGEFWYDLDLVAEKPLPTTLPSMECELGRWVRQHITLSNPTEETLELVPMISNTNNFMLERESERPIELRPHSTIRLPVTFMPSTLGPGDHHARIAFHCPQLGEWVYNVTGTGVLPQPQDSVSITALATSNATLIIPFRNPLDIPVIASVSFTDQQEKLSEALDETPNGSPGSPFCLLLKQPESGLRLGPKTTLDIPISFAPEDMRRFEGECVVKVRKEDGSPWRAYAAGASRTEARDGWDLNEIKWTYPIHGYPELNQGQDSPPALVQCQARERVEERLEVTLSGVAPSAGGPKRGVKARAVTPTDESPRVPEGVVVGETMAIAEEFSYELVYGDDACRQSLAPTVALKLVRQHRDKHSGLVVLVFNIVYAPYKTMGHDVQLLVQGATGGLWRFPLKFVATEPEPDDLVVVEAAGLNRESAVGFRLTSQTKHPIPYNAYFVAGSDPEFSVTPQSGELLPVGSSGSLISVVFTPTKYGKVYNGKLVVQATDMQWTYNIRGILPDYIAPRGFSSRPMAGPHPDPRKTCDKMNYVRENLRLTTTAVSSPIKGAPIIPRIRSINIDSLKL